MKDQYGNKIVRVDGAKVFINPGTWEMDDATEDNAVANMQAFLDECAYTADLTFERVPEKDYGGGRYAFVMRREGYDRTYEVQMPGRELERVRYMGSEGHNILNYPRLYIDDSSWVWEFALSLIQWDDD